MVTSTRKHRTRASELEPAWHVIDAEGKTLGRLSSEIAVLLQGKHKPTYVSYLNRGDFVIVTNAEKVHTTGKKLDQKIYYRHSGYPGGLKERTLAQQLEKAPTQVIKKAVKGMLPKNKLGRRMLSRLKLYAGSDHPHEAQVNAQLKTKNAELPEEGAGAVAVTPPTVAEEAAPSQPARRSRPKPQAAETPDGDETATAERPKARRSRAKAETQETEGEPTATAAPPRARRSRAKAAPGDADQGEPAEEA